MRIYQWIFLGLFLCMNAQAQEALPDKPPIPDDNPQTSEKVELGKMLYFDPRLSKNGTISCNSCHNLMTGGDDDRPVAAGVSGKLGERNSPTVWNSAFLSTQFWDGREPTLEEQAKGPLVNPVEMAMPNHELVVDRISKFKEYRKRFKKVFGKDEMNIDQAAKAIAAFERTLITPDAPFDRYKEGKKKALTKLQRQGFEEFKKVGCTTCHSGPVFAGPPQEMGQGFFMKFPTFPIPEYDKKYNFTEDKGRYEATEKEAHKNMWRVPQLRNVALTAPYFHNGSVENLSEVVRIMGKAQLNKDLDDKQVKSIVAFLKSLTGEFPEVTLPRLPEKEGTTVVD